jgi:hypothetical protein
MGLCGACRPAVVVGSHDSGDPTTTNIYVGNLSPAITEAVLVGFARFDRRPPRSLPPDPNPR